MNIPPPLIATTAMLGELLAAQGLVQPAEVARALAFQQQAGGRLGAVLVRMGALSEEALLPVLAQQLAMPLLDAAALRIARLAEPYPPLPVTEENIDILHVTRTWQFLPAGELVDD